MFNVQHLNYNWTSLIDSEYLQDHKQCSLTWKSWPLQTFWNWSGPFKDLTSSSKVTSGWLIQYLFQAKHWQITFGTIWIPSGDPWWIVQILLWLSWQVSGFKLYRVRINLKFIIQMKLGNPDVIVFLLFFVVYFWMYLIWCITKSLNVKTYKIVGLLSKIHLHKLYFGKFWDTSMYL